MLPKIRVTQEILDKCREPDSAMDPIASAIHQAWPWATRISVGLDEIRVTHPGFGRMIWPTPRVAQLAMVDFDLDKPIEPFCFEVT